MAVFSSWRVALSLAVYVASAPATLDTQQADSRGEDAHGYHIRAQRLQQTLERLGEFGRNPEGSVTRLGFSEADLAAREYLMGLMRQANLEVRVDPAGNIFGRRAGLQNLPVLLFGSHIDSVPHGGNFDGGLGSMGALEVMRALNDRNVKTRHPLEAVVWANEEGHHFGKGVFGSAAAAGLLDPAILERRDDEGLTLADWLRRYGQDPAHFTQARIRPGAVAGYVELHIEQGAVLEQAHIPIGVVEGIIGLNWWTCAATGFANHAGTTPMNRRRDALAASARAALAVREEVHAQPGRQVGTVGYMKVEPGARNIIPGRVEFSVDLRDLDADKIARIWSRIQKRFAEIGREESVQLECALLSSDQPARADPLLQQAIREAAQAAGLSTLELPSGAGHDAQNMARLAPMGMIFVPSRGGISHAPQEFTPWDQAANGVEVLYRTVLLADARLNRD